MPVRTVFRCVASRNRERTSRPRGAARHSKTGFDSDKRNARGYSWSSTFTGSDARYLGFNYGFLARMASKTPDGRGFQLRCLQEEGEDVPAPGYRDAMSTRGFGGLRVVGDNGYSWSSTFTGSNAHFLNFSYNGVGPQDYNSRAHGFPLRCLQE